MSRIVLRLFIAGRTTRSERAINNLRRLCAHALAEHVCDLAIIDVIAEPQIAEDERILATPTLIKDAPAPPRRIIGDLSDPAEVLVALGLPPYTFGDDAP